MRQHRPRPCASFPASHAYTAFSCDEIFISVSRCPALLRRGTTISRSVLGAGSESDTNINIVDAGCTVSSFYPNQLYTPNYSSPFYWR